MTLTLDNLDARYHALFELLGSRKPQVLAFKNFIERETSWLTAPASTRFHLNIERGRSRPRSAAAGRARC